MRVPALLLLIAKGHSTAHLHVANVLDTGDNATMRAGERLPTPVGNQFLHQKQIKFTPVVNHKTFGGILKDGSKSIYDAAPYGDAVKKPEEKVTQRACQH